MKHHGCSRHDGGFEVKRNDWYCSDLNKNKQRKLEKHQMKGGFPAAFLCVIYERTSCFAALNVVSLSFQVASAETEAVWTNSPQSGFNATVL